VIPLREQEYIRERFERELEGRVKIDYFTQRASTLYVPGREECTYCEDTRVMLEELSSLTDKVTLAVHDFASSVEEARKLGVDKVPGIVVRGPANRALRFFGIPGGNEFPNFVEALVAASKQRTELGAEAAKQVKKLKDRVSIAVYVTPTCPHCPGVVRAAYRLALASPHIDASAIEIGEFPRLAQQLGVRAVPFTVFNNQVAVAGAIDEQGLIEGALQAVDRGAVGAPSTTTRGATTEAAPPPAGGAQQSRLILPR
jgi:glutaredoxin-like protein